MFNSALLVKIKNASFMAWLLNRQVLEVEKIYRALEGEMGGQANATQTIYSGEGHRAVADPLRLALGRMRLADGPASAPFRNAQAPADLTNPLALRQFNLIMPAFAMMSLRSIANERNHLGIPTNRDRCWYSYPVRLQIEPDTRMACEDAAKRQLSAPSKPPSLVPSFDPQPRTTNNG